METLDLAKLKERMDSEGLNSFSLSKAAKLPRATVWRTVQGVTSPTLQTLARICVALKVKIGDLLND